MAGATDDPPDVGLARTEAAEAVAGEPTTAELGARPVSDRLVRAVSRAKIAGALFASDERVKLGRYHLLELVGSGGMGVVWGAWDPELDRRVAIKLVKATMQSARDRILLEGQALAKLSHPNVVPVFDVGVVDEQVYLVMEWVKGKNLRAFCKEPRSVREIVAVYRDAALGLAAAHHAGLIHRDFKPDNAIRGDDGRVRVLDFGLARGETKPGATGDAPTSSDLTRGAGTPRYMPPEQAQGGMLTPAVDQFAWCVSLREALTNRTADHTDADVPGWLDAIVTRGTATDPKARFATMDDLLRALARDPRTVWRRRAIVTGALGLAGAAFAIGTLRGGTDADKCTGGKDEIAKVWNPQVQDALTAKLAAVSTFAAEAAPKLVDELGHYSGGWVDARRGACLARDRGELPPQMYERTVACLARSRFALTAVIDVLRSVTAPKVPDAIIAAHSLPDAARCATDSTLSTVASPSPQIQARVPAVSDEVERARVLALAASDTADATSATALLHATDLGYAPLLARAQLSRGLALMATDHDRAAEAMGKAVNLALAAGDDSLATEAYARQVYAAATSDRPGPEATLVAEQNITMEPIALRTGAAGQFPRALMYMNLGNARLGQGDPDGARVWFEKSRAEVDAAGLRENPELAVLSSNMASVVATAEEREALVRDSATQLSRILGENHPLVLETRSRAAMFTANPGTITTALADICDRYQRFHPDFSPAIEDCTYELAWLAVERGDLTEARRRLQAVTSPESPRTPVATAVIELIDGDARGADQAAAQAAASKDDGWARMFVGDADLVCGMARDRLADPAGSIGCFTHALDEFARLSASFPGIFERRVWHARARLAIALQRTDPAKARSLAVDALGWYQNATGYDELVTALRPVAGVTGSR